MAEMTPEDDLVERTIKAIADPIAGAIKEGRDNAIRAAVAAEREACAEIALAIDSGRGNEKEIAAAIRARGNQKPQINDPPQPAVVPWTTRDTDQDPA